MSADEDVGLDPTHKEAKYLSWMVWGVVPSRYDANAERFRQKVKSQDSERMRRLLGLIGKREGIIPLTK